MKPVTRAITRLIVLLSAIALGMWLFTERATVVGMIAVSNPGTEPPTSEPKPPPSKDAQTEPMLIALRNYDDWPCS